MKVKHLALGACTLLALGACGPANFDQQMNEAAATVAARMNEAMPTMEAIASDPTNQAMVNNGMATVQALANDPTAQAQAADALATVQALANDPTAQAQLNNAIATMEAVGNDPTAQAMAATAFAGVDNMDFQAAVDQAFQAVNEQVTLTQGQPLSLDMLSGITDITSDKMTIVDAPAGAEADKGQVIKEASDGNISLQPDEYAKYFTVSGDYKIQLDITSGDKTASNEFTVTVP